jgi:hypothetical protein
MVRDYFWYDYQLHFRLDIEVIKQELVSTKEEFTKQFEGTVQIAWWVLELFY